MQLRHRGELALLKEVRDKFGLPSKGVDSGVIIGIGDDAAVFDSFGKKVLVTTDMMNEGIHFDLSYSAPFHLGFKLVSVNVSDIMAMGGVPRYLFLDIALKADAEEELFRELYTGIGRAMEHYGVVLLGGDLTTAVHDMVLAATVIGSSEEAIARRGASVGDRIYITSPTGDAACGLEILKRLAPASKRLVKEWGTEESSLSRKGGRAALPDLEIVLGTETRMIEGKRIEPLLRRHLMPVARQAGMFQPGITSMIDVSDGLFIDLCRICDESNVGAKVYRECIPLSAELRYAAEIIGLDPVDLATSGGEDYELLFTTADDIDDGAIFIGEITAKERVVIDKEGRESPLSSRGYEHFGTSG
ncbi:MAG: thiamine-phosphate kinase [Nitrospirota bacterium]